MPTFHTEFGPENGPQTLGDIAKRVFHRRFSASLSVKALASFHSPMSVQFSSSSSSSPPPRTVAKHQNGISLPEAERLSAAAHYMGARGSVILVSLASSGDNTADLRERSDKLKNHIVKFQRDHGMSPWWADMLEVHPKLHLHLFAAAPRGKVRRMCRAIEGSKILGDVDARPVYDMNGAVNYALGELTTEAKFSLKKRGRNIRRIKGSHKIPDGGDRQRLSRGLEREMIGAGIIKPWTKTNARRAGRLIDADAIAKDVERAKVGIFFADQLPKLSAPPKAKRVPQRREKIPPPTLQMVYPPTVVDMLAVLRERMTCEDIAESIGLSRQQTNNVAVERFDIGRKARERIVELARAA